MRAAALVERRERFYGLGSRLPGHVAPLFLKPNFLNLLNGFLGTRLGPKFRWEILPLPAPGPSLAQPDAPIGRLWAQADGSRVAHSRTAARRRTSRDDRFRQFGGAPQLP